MGLTKAQNAAIEALKNGGLIGEWDDIYPRNRKHSRMRYELFVRENGKIKVKKINKGTVFCLIAYGLIVKTDNKRMLPYSRDNWYELTKLGAKK